MRTIKIVDSTIRASSEKAGFQMSFKEKLEIAKIMDKLEVDVIELPAIVNQRTDTLLTKSIASTVKNSIVSCATGNTAEQVEYTWNAISGSVHPRLRVVLPTSPVQMEYITGKKPKQVLVLAEELVKKAASLCDDIEFSAVDATRSERDFLTQIISIAIANGAKTINICDTAGEMLPDEFTAFIGDMKERVPELNDVCISVTCSDGLNMANANAFMAITGSADQIKTTVGSFNMPTLESIINAITAKGDRYDIETKVKTVQLQKSIKQLSWLADVKANNSVFGVASSDSNEMKVSFNEDSDIAEVEEAVKALGYDLSEEDYANVYKEVKRVGKKKPVGKKDLEAIVATTALQVEPTYILMDYVINSGNIINSTACITLERAGQKLTGLASGDGPVEAALHAIEQILGHHYELDDFQIRSVTEGSSAMGNTIIRLRSNGKLYSGSGVSTDIIGASIRAYINAVNKIVFEFEE